MSLCNSPHSAQWKEEVSIPWLSHLKQSTDNSSWVGLAQKVESVCPLVFTSWSELHFFFSAIVSHATSLEKSVFAHNLAAKLLTVKLVVLIKVWQLKVLPCWSWFFCVGCCLIGLLHPLDPIVCAKRADNRESEPADVPKRMARKT